jgi:hypothetical protein
MESKLTIMQAFKSMQCFLLKYYERTGSDDIGSLLGDMQLLKDLSTADPAVWNDWIKCINEIQNKQSNTP